MPRQPLRLPKQWSRHVKSGILHAIALASVAIAFARGRATGNRRRLAQLDQAMTEIALLREELAIKDGRILAQLREETTLEWQGFEIE